MFIWACRYDNGASDWRDSERCLACSRKSYKTKKEAEDGAKRHQYRTGHSVEVKDIGRTRWP